MKKCIALVYVWALRIKLSCGIFKFEHYFKFLMNVGNLRLQSKCIQCI